MSNDNAEMGTVHDIANYVLGIPAQQEIPVGLNSAYAYVLRVNLGDTNFAGYMFLLHNEQYNDEQLTTKLAEAIEVVKKIRISPRRAGLQVKSDTDIVGSNEMYFTADIRDLETVLCDKFDFRKLQVANASSVIEPTIKQAA